MKACREQMHGQLLRRFRSFHRLLIIHVSLSRLWIHRTPPERPLGDGGEMNGVSTKDSDQVGTKVFQTSIMPFDFLE